MISYVSSYNLLTATYGTPEFLEMWSCISRFSCCFCFRLRISDMNSCMCDNAFLVGVSMKLLICICELLNFDMVLFSIEDIHSELLHGCLSICMSCV